MMTDEMEILQNKHQKKLKERIFKRRYFYTTNFTKPEMDGMEYESHNININTALMHHKVYIRSQDINSLNKIIPIKKYIKINEFPKFNEEDRIIEFHPDGTATEYICKITLKGLRILHGDLITVLTKEEKEWKYKMNRYRNRWISPRNYITINFSVSDNEDRYFEKSSVDISYYLTSRFYNIKRSELDLITKLIDIQFYNIIEEFPEFNEGDKIIEIHSDNTVIEYTCNTTLIGMQKRFGKTLSNSEYIKLKRLCKLTWD